MQSKLILKACLISSIAACDSVSGPDTESGRLVEQLTPASLEAVAGSVIDPAPTIRVTDERTGNPLRGITVEFRVWPGSGQVENAVTTTDASGIATAGKWRVGNFVGRYGLTAIAAVLGSRATFTLRVKPDAPAKISLMDNSIVGMAGEAIDWPGVRVVDRFGNATPQIPVAFAVQTGSGVLQTTSATTSADGIAAPGTWRLGSIGENVLIVSSPGIEPARIVAQGLDPARITQYTLDSVRLGTEVRAPDLSGILSSTLTMVTFDPCLCRVESGYYIIDIEYRNQPSFEPRRLTGSYRIDPLALVIVDRKIGNARFENGRVILTIERDDFDWGPWKETWIFRPSVARDR